MTQNQAYAAAAKRAKATQEWRYVVFEDGYHIASDFDLETFYAGAPVVAAFGPDGSIEQ